MRVLVVGTLPPPGGDGAMRLARVVGDLVAAGHEVETLSPDRRSAAHGHAALEGPLLAIQLARRAPRFDAAVLSFEPGLPFAPDTHRALRAATLLALGLGLRGYRELTIRLSSPIPIPGGVGGRASRELWTRASSIVVATGEDVERVLEAPGVRAEKVTVDHGTGAAPRAAAPGWRGLEGTERDLREIVQVAVRERASLARSIHEARAELADAPPPASEEDPFVSQSSPEPAVRVGALATVALLRGRAVASRVLRRVRPRASS